jgi:valyl-tRNA synthetase
MESMVDPDAEKARLQKEIEQTEAEVARLAARLGNNVFLSKAPANVVDKERNRLAERQDKRERLKQQLTRLG